MMRKFKKVYIYIACITIILGLSEYIQVKDKFDKSSGDSYTGESLFKNASLVMDFSYLYRNVTDDQMNSLSNFYLCCTRCNRIPKERVES